jgi:hypothetical protein
MIQKKTFLHLNDHLSKYFFSLYIFIYLFFSFKVDKYLQISIPTLLVCAITPLIIIMSKPKIIMFRLKNYLCQGEGVCLSFFLLFLLLSSLINYKNFSFIYDDVSRAFYVSIITHLIFRIFFTEKIDYHLLYKIFSFFLILSGVLSTWQYFDDKISWVRIFSSHVYDQRGAGFSDFPQDNSGLCLWAFVAISIKYYVSKNLTRSHFLKLTPIFFGFIAILNSHSRSSFLTLIILFAIMFTYSIVYRENLLNFTTYILTILFSMFILFAIFSMNHVNFSRIHENMNYVLHIEESVKNYNLESQTTYKEGDISDIDRSTNSRLHSYIYGLKLVREHLVFGVGPGKFREYYGEYKKSVNNSYLDPSKTMHIHNYLISILVELGLLCFVSFALLQFFIIKSTLLNSKKNSDPIIFCLSFIFLSFWLLFTASISQRLFWIALVACSHQVKLSNK